ncbi:sigma-70 family RNA polymerase sigma factor [Novosphingobium sp. ZW T3_23]|uniref:sigma-70 family RNA polymerase sigma factor n=1 Tax=Novosphingobium sp. ZW T3_23 TaxID=3378084 RepID=UPI0038536A32
MGANSAVLASLIITERSALLRRVERLVDDPADAEEVVQSMWLKVQSVDDTRSILSKRAYLFRLARNLALDFRRSQQRRGRLADEVQNILTDSDDAPGQDRIVDSTQMLERVRTAALALPEPTRTIFRLNRFEGESQQAIARRLGISATTVENHIRRALAALAAARDGRDPET